MNKICYLPTLGNLPTSYTTSLTFVEQLLQLNNKINEIIDAVNQFSPEEIQKMIDDSIAIFKNYVDNENNKLYNYINLEIENTKSYIDESISNLSFDLINLMNQKIKFLTDYIDSKDASLRWEIQLKFNEIEEQIKDITLNGIKIIDPTTGISDSIQNVINHIYDNLRYFAITAGDYDTLELTAEEYDNKQITAFDYDINAKNILLPDKSNYMYNPFTGDYEKLSDVINYLANFHKDSPITAKEYDDLNLTAINYDNKKLTAYDYDFNAKTLLTA